MLSDLTARANIRGRQIDLSWDWVSSQIQRPNLRLQRQQIAYPVSAVEGVAVLDVAQLFRLPQQPWALITQTQYTLSNAPIEDGLRQAELTTYFANANDLQPTQVRIGIYVDLTESWQAVVFDSVTNLTVTETAAAPWQSLTTWEITAMVGGGPAAIVGQVVVSRGHADGLTPDQFAWIPAVGTSVLVPFVEISGQETHVEEVTTVAGYFRAQFSSSKNDDPPQRHFQLEENFNPDSGDWQRHFQLQDAGLTPETVYYYRLFAADAALPDQWRSEYGWSVSAMATGHYEFGQHLYNALPALHKQYDEPTPGSQGNGQLRSFLNIFGLGLDQSRSQVNGLRQRHDLLTVDAAHLPYLARWIGWELDQTINERAQRNEIRFAPEIYATTGTVPTIRALVNRLTDWDCQVKEFVHNVMLTNAPESARLWELWEMRHDGLSWSSPVPRTRTEGFDGHPTAATTNDNTVWLLWHANRAGRRELWLQRQDGVDALPQRAMQEAPDDQAGLTYADEYPTAVADGAHAWLFWQTNRDGQWDIWARTYDSLPGSAPLRLTDHAQDDRQPAAVRDNVGRIWVFWQSNRRGPTDIWSRTFDGLEWSLPARVTTAALRHESPAAAVDGTGRLWLFWSDDQGDRRHIYAQVRSGTVWSQPQEITSGPQRDEAPSAVFYNGQIWLFWHSNRNGRWQIWGKTHNGGWSADFQLTDHVMADKEATAVLDGSGQLRLVWRSQRRAQNYQSRTVDSNDIEMMTRLGTFQDRAHYTYDTGRDDNNDWYARDTVGLYLTPDTEDAALTVRSRNLITVVQQFLPANVRAVFIINPPIYAETVYTYDAPEAEPQHTIGETAFDSLNTPLADTFSGLTDPHSDSLPGWTWLHTWSNNTPNHHSVDTAVPPIDLSFRTQHTDLDSGG